MCRVMIVHAQIPECPLPMEGPRLSILRQCIFEVLLEQVRMSAAFGFKLQTGFQRVWSDSNFLVENDISIK